MLQRQLMSENMRTKLAILRMIAYITEDWKDTADTQLANVKYTQVEVDTIQQFVASFVVIASSRLATVDLKQTAQYLI
jgi:hypothetical protein